MRIRKRFPPPSSLPLSDPQLNRPLLVQQQFKRDITPCQENNTKNQTLPSDLPNLTLPQPSDQLTKGKSTTWVLFGGNSSQDKMKEKEGEMELAEDEKWREKVKSFNNSLDDNDNNRRENFLTPQLASSLLLQLSSASSHDQDWRWCEGDKAIPLKKRRDSYHNTSMNTIEDANYKLMKSKTNKKCPQEVGLITHEEGFESSSNNKVGGVKKNKRGNVILEGSRCSRVNGRGWRCCQQTLVGYSLCEHHLGKGRLRSMTSVRNAPKKKKQEEEILEEKISLPNDNMENQDHDHMEESVLLVTKKKTKKLGMVKARSLSSLLGQTDDAVVAVKKTDDESFLQRTCDNNYIAGSQW